MGKLFTVNMNRFDPYKTFRFQVFFGQSTSPVAGVSKITGLKRSSDVIEYKEAGSMLVRKGLGRTKYEAATLERGLSYDNELELWANAAQVLETGHPSSSLKNLRKDIRIELMNEAGQPVHRYFLYSCWVSEYQALPDLDAGGNAVAIEHIKIETEGWEHDLTLVEQQES